MGGARRGGVGTLTGEVLIVGAGPAGLSLAIGLRLRGVAVTVIDAADGPKRQPRAAVVWPRTAQSLDALGLGPALRTEAAPLNAAHVHVRGRPRGTLRLGALPLAFPRPLVIEQDAVERLLLARFAALGGEVRWNTPFQALVAHADHAHVRLAGATERFARVVGADGGRSRVRRAAAIAFAGRPRPDVVCVQVNAQAHWRFDDRPGEGRFFLGEHATLGAFVTPSGDHRLYVFKRDEDPERTSPPTLEEMQTLVRRITGDVAARLEAPANPWLNFARFQQRLAARLSHGPVTLVGDAAHVWPAVGGHGMAVGVAGAERLAAALPLALTGDEAALDAYDRTQRALVLRVMRLADWDVLERPHGPAALAALDLLLLPMLAAPIVARGVERVIASLAHPLPPGAVTRLA